MKFHFQFLNMAVMTCLASHSKTIFPYSKTASNENADASPLKNHMKEKQKIWALFDKLRPVIISKLLNSKDKYVLSGGAQLVVPLNAEESGNLTTEQQYTALPSDFPNIWYVYPNEKINLPWETWETYLIISLKTDDMRKYRLTVSLTAYGCNDVVSHGQSVCEGSIEEITHYEDFGKFQSNASSAFNGCLNAIDRKIVASEEYRSKVKLFANTDITDFDSVMKFVVFLKDESVLKSIGRSLELFTYDRVISLIDKSSRRINVLVDKDGKAQFCRIEDFPSELLKMIRLEKRGWNLSVHSLSVGKFNDKGQAFVTWVISPYYYCPMDEDGFGEEEEFEVAVTCHINTDGHLIDTPVWKPYTGPRR